MRRLTSLRDLGLSKKAFVMLSHVLLSIIFAIHNTIEFQNVKVTGLDLSWIFMLNHFFYEKYQHGSNIIFNYGPLGFMFSSGYYLGAEDLKYILSIIYHIILFHCMFFVLKVNTVFRFLWVSIVVFMMAFSFTANIIIPSIIICYHEIIRDHKKLSAYYVSIMLSLLLAVASLVKSSSLVSALPLIIIITLYRFSIRDYYPVVLVSYCFFTGVLLILAGQDVANWGDFYRGYLDVSISYNADMTLPASPFYLGLWCVGVLIVLSSFQIKSLKAITLILCMFVCILVAYKLSFVRHGSYAYLAFWVLYFIATMQIFSPFARFYGLAHRGLVMGTAACSLATSVFIVSSFFPEGIGSANMLTVLQNRLTFFWDAGTREQQKLNNLSAFNEEIADLRLKFPFKDVVGPIDAFPFDLGLAYSTGLDLATRPAFQAYYATSRLMTERNRDFLVTDRAARSIIFSLLPIDGRFPSLEDPLTVRAFRRFYKVDQQTADQLLLVRRETPLAETETCKESLTRLDTPITAPSVSEDQAVWARVSLTPTVLGRLAAFFLKGPTLGLTVTTAGGGTQEFRFLRDAGDVGFLLSPAFISLDAAAAFYRGESRAQDAVSQIQVRNRTGDGVIRWFQPEIAVSLCTLSWSSASP